MGPVPPKRNRPGRPADWPQLPDPGDIFPGRSLAARSARLAAAVELAVIATARAMERALRALTRALRRAIAWGPGHLGRQARLEALEREADLALLRADREFALEVLDAERVVRLDRLLAAAELVGSPFRAGQPILLPPAAKIGVRPPKATRPPGGPPPTPPPTGIVLRK